MNEEHVVIIDRNSSSCGWCGKNALPEEGLHRTVPSYGGSYPGCLMPWYYMRSNYIGLNMKKACESKFPHLKWIGEDSMDPKERDKLVIEALVALVREEWPADMSLSEIIGTYVSWALTNEHLNAMNAWEAENEPG